MKKFTLLAAVSIAALSLSGCDYLKNASGSFSEGGGTINLPPPPPPPPPPAVASADPMPVRKTKEK